MPSPRHFVALALLGLAGASFAHDPVAAPERQGWHDRGERQEWRHDRHQDERYDRRDEQRFERRLHRGEASGALTWQEARALERQWENIDAFERRYRADGHFTSLERTYLAQMRSSADRSLQRELHDRQVAWRR